MTNILKQFFQDLFASEFSKRLLIVSLLPNVLVGGYWLNGFNNDASHLWVMFLSPYLNVEIYIFYFIIGSIIVVDFVYPIVASIVGGLMAVNVEKPKEEEYVAPRTYQNYDRSSWQSPVDDKRGSLPEPPKKPDPPPPTAAEIKRKALRDITGRGA